MTLAAYLDLNEEWGLLVGGGAVASRRAATLKAAGLRVRVTAPTILPALRAQADAVNERSFEEADLDGVRLVVACTDRPEVNDAVTALALRRGLLANHAGEAGRGNLRFPVTLEQGGLRLALSTGHELPMLAQALRERLAATLPQHLPLADWQARRDAALLNDAGAREAALTELRRDIRAAVGLA